MNNPQNNIYAEKLNKLERHYTALGYLVIKRPAAEELPFNLHGYSPDLIATKPDSGIIVQIQAADQCISIDRIQQIAQEIAEHPGWRFMLVTLEDVDTDAIPTTAGELPTWPQLIRRMERLGGLLERDAVEPAFLYLWSIFEASLRRRAIDQHIPVERLPSVQLLDHMYSQGEVSVNQIDAFHDFLKQWTRVAHGALHTIENSFVRQLVSDIRDLLIDWSEPPGAKDITLK